MYIIIIIIIIINNNDNETVIAHKCMHTKGKKYLFETSNTLILVIIHSRGQFTPPAFGTVPACPHSIWPGLPSHSVHHPHYGSAGTTGSALLTLDADSQRELQ